MPGVLDDRKTHCVDKEEASDAINLGFKTVSHDISISKQGKYGEKHEKVDVKLIGKSY